MSVYTPPPNNQTPRRSYWNDRFRMAQLTAIRNRQALENGGPVKLDVAALKKRLEERKAKNATGND